MTTKAAVRGAAIACAWAAVAGGCGSGATTNHGTATPASAPATRAETRAAAAVPDGDWTQFDDSAQRTGVGPANTGITTRTLGELRARVVRLPGTVDSAAIQVHDARVGGRSRDVIVVTTTYGLTVAIDAQTGRKVWQFTPSGIGSLEGSSQVTTATPIADPDRRYVYAASPNGYIHKLSLMSGRQVTSGGWPVFITHDPTREKIPSSLNISGANVIVTTDGYFGDAPPYQGHVVLINRATGRIANVFNALCSNRSGLIVPRTCPGSDAGIWARAGAVIEPDSGRILVATGNGPFNGSTDWGDSVLELTPTASGLLHNWTPQNQAQLNSGDGDVGSTAPALLGVAGGINLAVQGGKDGVLSLLDLDRLNGTTGGAGPRLGGQLQTISAPGGAEVLTTPVVWHHGGQTWVFVADNAATAAYRLGGVGGARLTLVWERQTAGTSPVLAGGLLYVYDPNGGRLVIDQPTTGRVLDTLPAASGHWNSPIVVGGRIVLPVGSYFSHATSGTLFIYHLPGR